MQGNKVAAVALIILVVFAVGVVLQQAKPILFPFFLAVFLSFILSPILDFLTRIKIPRAVSILFILITSFFIIYLLGLLFYSSGKTFASEFPKYGHKISSILASIQEQLKLTFPKWETVDWFGQLDINKIGGLLLSSIGPFFLFYRQSFSGFYFYCFYFSRPGKYKSKS